MPARSRCHPRPPGQAQMNREGRCFMMTVQHRCLLPGSGAMQWAGDALISGGRGERPDPSDFSESTWLTLSLVWARIVPSRPVDSVVRRYRPPWRAHLGRSEVSIRGADRPLELTTSPLSGRRWARWRSVRGAPTADAERRCSGLSVGPGLLQITFTTRVHGLIPALRTGSFPSSPLAARAGGRNSPPAVAHALARR